MTKPETLSNSYIHEVVARMQTQLVGKPSALIAGLEQQLQAGNNHVRPTLTLLLGNMFGVEPDTLVNLAASIEMLHHAKLVHDNLNMKSTYKLPNAAFITSATVLAGDLAFAAAACLATAPQSTAVMRIFSETLQLMVSGEITHMFQNGTGFTREAYYGRIHATSASLFELAGQATAILGSAEDKLIKASRQFGYEIGIAYQIIEDTLDFMAIPEREGKPTGQSLRHGIVTLPVIYYLEAYPHDSEIRSIINRNGHSPKAIDRVIKDIQNSDAIARALDEATAFSHRGLEVLDRLPNTPERIELELLTTQMIPNQI